MFQELFYFTAVQEARVIFVKLCKQTPALVGVLNPFSLIQL